MQLKAKQQEFLHLAIDKSQGLTFDKVTVDFTKECFAKGQAYVALSRVTTPEGLRIIVNR